MLYQVLFINIICICLAAYFWRLGGDGHDLYRNPGVPILLATVRYGTLCLFTGLSWYYLLVLLYIPALWGMIQAFSYGVSAPPHKVWVWIIGKLNGQYDNPAWKGMADNGQIPGIEVCTRSTCGFFWSIPAVIFAFLSGAWILFSIYSLFLTIACGLIYYFIPDVEINEPAVGACVSTSLII